MGVFDDNKLENLDWMTQMTETIESDLNSILSRLPDRIQITSKDILDNSHTYLSFSTYDAVAGPIRDRSKGESLSWDEQRLLEGCFAFELKGEIEIDLRTGILSGEITVVKTKQTFSDEELQPLMGRRGIDSIGRASNYGGTDAPLDRLNEILDNIGWLR